MWIAIVGAIVFAVIYFWPESTNAGVAGRLHLGDGGIRAGVQIGHAGRHDHWNHGPWKHDRRKRDHWKRESWNHGHHGHDWPKPGSRAGLPLSIGPVFLLPRISTQRVIVRETVVAPPLAPAPAAVAAPAPAAVAVPVTARFAAPDPQGRARTVPVRGGDRPREWVLGAALPPDLPHVALAASTYGLPEPPPGQMYARVGGDVLRIEAGTRRIVAVVSR